MKVIKFQPDCAEFRRLLDRAQKPSPEIAARVADIIQQVRQDGDIALCEFSHQFDRVALLPEELRVTPEEIDAGAAQVDADFMTACVLARVNIRKFHEYQRRVSYEHPDGDGVRLAKRVLPLSRVGIYVPAGSAPLFSSLLMCAVPAQIAGVEQIAVCAGPDKNGKIPAPILATAKMLNLTEIYRVGGAQAIAALAYGTKTIAPVDKIVGPGGPYVNMAKRLVFGQCGIDSLAGPSELAIIADRTAPSEFVAADLISQLEHGSGHEAAALFTDSRDLAAGVLIEIDRQLQRLSRGDLIRQALASYGAIFYCSDLAAAVEAANRWAPEHLEIIAADQEDLLSQVRNAGAVFLGAFSAEPVGDYFAGTNHVLPTAGSARFMSSLSVYDFVKDISVIRYTAARLAVAGRHIIKMATAEGLTAHAAAVQIRLDKIGGGESN